MGYKDKKIGKHRIDHLVENEVVIELKVVKALNKVEGVQL